jgi:hypothetical protein
MGFGDLIKKLSAQELLKPCHQIARPIKLSGATAPASNRGAQIEGADNSRHIGTAICGDSGSEVLGSLPLPPQYLSPFPLGPIPFSRTNLAIARISFLPKYCYRPMSAFFKHVYLTFFALVLLGFHVALVRTFYVSFNRIPQWKE